MRILRRPMFKKGGSANSGIMSGLVDRSTYAGGGTIGGGTIQGTPMGYRTGFVEPYPIGSTVSQSKAAAKAIADMYGVWQESDLVNKASKVAKPSRLASWFGRTGIGTLPIAYFGLSKAIQESLPEELKSTPDFAYGKKGIYERAGYPDPMSAGADISPEVDEILRSADRGEGRKDPMGSGFYDTLIEHGGGLTEEAKEKRKIKRLSDKLDKDKDLGISAADARAVIADKRSVLSKRAKEFSKLMSPHATKRMFADVMEAASLKAGESTGDTRQDIVNMITAAAGASKGQRATYDKAMELAIMEDIQKGLKTNKVSETDKLFAKYQIANPQEEGESDSDYYKRLLKKMSTGKIPIETKLDFEKAYTNMGETKEDGRIAWAKRTYGGHNDFGGILDPDNMPEQVQGKKYYDPDADNWKDHKSEITTPPGE
tara:strand:- start:355 stop:1641 length:1287 start_codon:yes stop_codon:yes gene_type:complete